MRKLNLIYTLFNFYTFLLYVKKKAMVIMFTIKIQEMHKGLIFFYKIRVYSTKTYCSKLKMLIRVRIHKMLVKIATLDCSFKSNLSWCVLFVQDFLTGKVFKILEHLPYIFLTTDDSKIIVWFHRLKS